MKQIALGTWSWGNKLLWGYEPSKNDTALEETLKESINGQIYLIDTADSYGIGALNGRSEELIGQFLQKISPEKKEKLTIATKLAPYPWRIGRNGFKRAFEASHKRLKGHLHRVQLHWSTSRYAPWQEADLIDGLGDLVEDGLVNEIGVSNVGPKRLLWMSERLEKRSIPIKSVQIQFSLLSPGERFQLRLKEICKAKNIEMLAYSPLALGILTLPPEAKMPQTTFLRQKVFNRLNNASKSLRECMHKITLNRKVSQVEVALNWCHSHEFIPIVGLRKPSHAKEVICSRNWNLSEEEKTDLNNYSMECKTKMPQNPFISN